MATVKAMEPQTVSDLDDGKMDYPAGIVAGTTEAYQYDLLMETKGYLELAKRSLDKFNKIAPSREGSLAATKADEFRQWLRDIGDNRAFGR